LYVVDTYSSHIKCNSVDEAVCLWIDCSLICPLGLTDIIILTVESKMSLQQIVVLVRVLFLACHGMCVWVLIACCSCWVGRHEAAQ